MLLAHNLPGENLASLCSSGVSACCALGATVRISHGFNMRIACGGRHLNCFGPNINIFRDPRWGRGHETFGEDPFLTGTLAAAFMRGLQSNDSQYIKARPFYHVPPLSLSPLSRAQRTFMRHF